MSDQRKFKTFDVFTSPLIDRSYSGGHSLPIENSAMLHHALEAQGVRSYTTWSTCSVGVGRVSISVSHPSGAGFVSGVGFDMAQAIKDAEAKRRAFRGEA